MIRRRRALRTLAIASAALSAPVRLAFAQDFGERSMKPASPSESRPKVDEKAYKAALDHVPAPTTAYDPRGSARPVEPDKATKRLN
jgi:hypothetical protein